MVEKPDRAGRQVLRPLPLLLLLPAVLIMADAVFFTLAPPDFPYPDHREPEVWRADAAAVLFHDFADQYRDIDTESRRRVNHAVSMYRRGKVGYLIMAGGYRPQKRASGSRLMARYAQGQGVPAERILTDSDSRDTLGNLANIDRIVTANGWHRVFLVSSPYHLQRLARLSEVDLTARADLAPYDPSACAPALTRYETWRSVHYNLVAYLLRLLLPESLYPGFVAWVRTHTTL
jgi:hypothetical protein